MPQARVTRSLAGALLISVLAVAGCGGPRSAGAMNESAVATNQRLFALGKDFGVAVAAALQSGQEADARRVRDA